MNKDRKFHPPGFWTTWLLLMTMCFVCMQRHNGWGALILQTVTIVLITYSLALKLNRSPEP